MVLVRNKCSPKHPGAVSMMTRRCAGKDISPRKPEQKSIEPLPPNAGKAMRKRALNDFSSIAQEISFFKRSEADAAASSSLCMSNEIAMGWFFDDDNLSFMLAL
jgi:hypothetical protein